jgi:hypothetical protein
MLKALKKFFQDFERLVNLVDYFFSELLILLSEDEEPPVEPEEEVEWAICIHPNRAKVFKIAHNESSVLGYAFLGEEYALDKVHVFHEGNEYGYIDLRPWHTVKFVGHDFGYIWLDDPHDRWRTEFKTKE